MYIYTYIYIYIYVHISACISRATLKVARPREQKDEAKVETEHGVCKVILTVLPANGVQTACYYFIERSARIVQQVLVSSRNDTLCFEEGGRIGIKQGELKEGRVGKEKGLLGIEVRARSLTISFHSPSFSSATKQGRKGEP